MDKLLESDLPALNEQLKEAGLAEMKTEHEAVESLTAGGRSETAATVDKHQKRVVLCYGASGDFFNGDFSSRVAVERSSPPFKAGSVALIQFTTSGFT